jgi:hypothetical protein
MSSWSIAHVPRIDARRRWLLVDVGVPRLQRIRVNSGRSTVAGEPSAAEDAVRLFELLEDGSDGETALARMRRGVAAHL